jgi:uncharacterized membrane protein YgcG
MYSYIATLLPLLVQSSPSSIIPILGIKITVFQSLLPYLSPSTIKDLTEFIIHSPPSPHSLTVLRILPILSDYDVNEPMYGGIDCGLVEVCKILKSGGNVVGEIYRVGIVASKRVESDRIGVCGDSSGDGSGGVVGGGSGGGGASDL